MTEGIRQGRMSVRNEGGQGSQRAVQPSSNYVNLFIDLMTVTDMRKVRFLFPAGTVFSSPRPD